MTHSNIAEARPDRALSLYDLRLHVLSSGDGFDLAERRPTQGPALADAHTLEAKALSSGVGSQHGNEARQSGGKE